MVDIIRTYYDRPPVPVRSCDWSAYIAGEEEGGVSGWGPTRQAAIEDLLEQIAEEVL